jgi:hypothetical protein
VTPAVLAAATIWLVILMVRARASGRPTPDGTGGATNAPGSVTTATRAARPA